MAMEKNESMERFCEGLKKAASRFRELGEAQSNRVWNQAAFYLEGLLSKGETIYNSKAISRQDALSMVDKMAAKISKDNMVN